MNTQRAEGVDILFFYSNVPATAVSVPAWYIFWLWRKFRTLFLCLSSSVRVSVAMEGFHIRAWPQQGGLREAAAAFCTC